jgi:SET domain-containing protein
LGGFTSRPIKQGEVFAGNYITDFRGYNHSDDPNFQLRRVNGIHREIALRDLAEGEEITVDYYDVGNEAFWVKP